MLASISENMREQSRKTQSSCHYDWKRHTQNLRNPRHCWMKHRLWVVLYRADERQLTHANRCKLHTEAESARADTVAQRTPEMKRIRVRGVDVVFMPV